MRCKHYLVQGARPTAVDAATALSFCGQRNNEIVSGLIKLKMSKSQKDGSGVEKTKKTPDEV